MLCTSPYLMALSILSPNFKLRIGLALLLLMGLTFSFAFGNIFTVTTLGDPGLGTSFRNTINSSNSTPGTDTIRFAVSGTITLNTGLPALTDRVFIDGTSAPGYTGCGDPVITINGASAGVVNGIQLLFGASGSTLSALNIRSFQLNGVQLIDSDANTIRGCYIGTNTAGTLAFQNGANGIQIEAGSDFNIIGGTDPCDKNVISGNFGSGVSLNASSSNIVIGNHIGVSDLGNAAVGNRGIGVLITNGANLNRIGGPTLQERNIISANGNGLTGNGVDINGSNNTLLQNNYIGVDVSGGVALGNAENGISINSSLDTQVGGPGALEGNVISNHNFHAMVLNGGSNNTTIQGNRVGTNAAGTAAMGNDDSGVIVINSSNVTIGGTAAGEGNLLSGSLSEYGIFVISSSNVTVEGNLIGTDITGSLPIPNFDGGVRIDFNSDNNTVGGSAAGAANTIAFNTGYGVGILSADCSANLISRNSIFCNTGKGIELNTAGNNNYPSPLVSTISVSGVSGTAQPFDIVELFYDSTCAASCQGKDFIASVNANGAGAWSYSGALNPNSTVVAIGIRTTAPAAQVNNTSEAICTVILPVEWETFEVRPGFDHTVNLDWATSSEINADFFDIERSADGLFFEKIGQVPATNMDGGSIYSFTDPAALEGLSVYRLRQQDFNGTFTYSETRQIWLDPLARGIEWGPNPAHETLRFRVNGEVIPSFSYALFDPAGKVILSGLLEETPEGWVEVPVKEIASGMYYLRLFTGQGESFRKIVIRH